MAPALFEFEYLQNSFHSHFLRFQTAALIKFHGCCIAAPDIQRHIVAALFSGKGKDSFIQLPAGTSAAAVLIYAEVIDIKGFDVRQNMAVRLLEDAEGVSENSALRFFRNKNGPAVVMNDLQQLIVCIFAGSGLKEVRPPPVVNHGHLQEQLLNRFHITFFCPSDVHCNLLPFQIFGMSIGYDSTGNSLSHDFFLTFLSVSRKRDRIVL